MDKALANKIKSRLPLSSVAKTAIELKGKSPNFIALCPFHQEKTPSFHVRDDVNRFKCFGCGAAGDIFEFVMRLRGISFLEAMTELSAKAGINLAPINKTPHVIDQEKSLLQAQGIAQDYFTKQLADVAGAKARRYLMEERGLSESMIKQAGLGFGGKSKDDFLAYLSKHHVSEKSALEAGLIKQGRFSLTGQFLERISFPIRDFDGRIVAFGGRSLVDSDDSPKYVNTHSYQFYEKRKNFYGLFESKKAILKGKVPILVEGYFDAMALWALGQPALALCGTALSSYHIALLKRLTRRLMIGFDADDAGLNALRNSLLELFKHDIQTSVISLEKKDPGAYLAMGQLKELQNILSSPLDACCYVIDRIAIAAQGGVYLRMQQIDGLLPILENIQRPLLRRQYVSYLAKCLHEDSAILWAEIEQKIKKSKKPRLKREASRAAPHIAISATEKLLLRIILAYPQLITEDIEISSLASFDMFALSKIVSESASEDLLNTQALKEHPFWPSIREVITEPIDISREEAQAVLLGMKNKMERGRCKEAVKHKRIELQEFEKKRDYLSAFKSLSEASALLAKKPKEKPSRIVPEVPANKAVLNNEKKISDLDDDAFFDPHEAWM